MTKFDRSLLRKYFIMGSQNCTSDPVVVLERAIRGGITLFQFREKGHGSKQGAEKLQLGKKLRSTCKEHGIPFIVNDDLELAERLDADGIHVGQDDRSVEDVRSQFPDKIIGLSISTKEELDKSPLEVADYIGAGPMFPTASKEDAKAVVGPKWVEIIRESYPELPIVGVGGIDTGNAHLVLEAGADGVSFISAVTKADDIEEAVKNL